MNRDTFYAGTEPDETYRKPIQAARLRQPANVRPAYQNTSDAMDIAVKALQLAASNARMEGAPPALIEKLTSQAARLSAARIEVMKGNPA